MISSLDHLVLTVADVQRTVDFYTSVLNMQVRRFADNRVALHFGTQKINLHQAGAEHLPHAGTPLPGSADLCFLIEITLDELMAHLQGLGIAIEAGPVQRSGACGPIQSVYLRDPDANLIELARPE